MNANIGQTRTEVLKEANDLINGDRNVDYGDPNDDFRKTAGMWDIYLKSVYERRDHLLPHDVAVLMSMLKLSRIAWSPERRDNWVDLAGYAACGWDCVENTY
jgi:hypothetical protein